MHRRRVLIALIGLTAATPSLWRAVVQADDRTASSAVAAVTPAQSAQDPAPRQPVAIPAGATALEGVPTVRINSDEGSTRRRVLGEAEAAKDRLRVNVVDGRFYWTTKENRALRLDVTDGFTYLSSEPGHYIRLTQLNNKIMYAEHVDLTFGSVTWFGELKIAIGK